MSEFEPVHYQVLDKIESKLKAKNLTDIETDDPRITKLLKYVQMQNGSLILNQIDQHLDELQTNDSNSIKSPKSSPLGIKSPFQKSIPLSPSLPSITENNDNTANIQNAENKDEDNELSQISNAAISKQFEHQTQRKTG